MGRLGHVDHLYEVSQVNAQLLCNNCTRRSLLLCHFDTKMFFCVCMCEQPIVRQSQPGEQFQVVDHLAQSVSLTTGRPPTVGRHNRANFCFM